MWPFGSGCPRVFLFVFGLALMGATFPVRSQNGKANSSKAERKRNPPSNVLQTKLPAPVGTSLERELRGGVVETIPLTLEAGRFLEAEIVQKGIDVKIRGFGPDGVRILEVDEQPSKVGTESIRFVAKEGGVFRLEIESTRKDAVPGRFEFKIVTFRPAGPEDWARGEIETLLIEAKALSGKEDWQSALAKVEKALELSGTKLGAEHRATGDCLFHLGRVRFGLGDIEKSEAAFGKAAALYRKALGNEHPYVGLCLEHSARMLYENRDYGRAEPMLLEAVSMFEKGVGSEHPQTAQGYYRLGLLYAEKGIYDKSDSYLTRALAIRERIFNPDQLPVAESMSALADLRSKQGRFSEAEALFLRALPILEKEWGPDHREVAETLNGLAGVYFSRGDYARAEPVFIRVLDVFEKTRGRDHPNVAAILNNLGVLYRAKGDFDKAEPLFLRALAINEKNLGPDNMYVAHTLSTLGLLYVSKKEPAKAEPLYLRALPIYEKNLGPNHPFVAFALNNLATLYQNRKEFAKAEPLFARALAINEKALGPDHPTVAAAVNNLALVYKLMGDPEKAEPLFFRALAVYEKRLGDGHPSVVVALHNLARVYQDKNDPAKAVSYLSRANEAAERDLRRNLFSGSERQKLLYLAKSSEDIEQTVAFQVLTARDNKEAVQTALTAVLRRKGRALDATAEGVEALRRRASPEDKALLDDLIRGKSQLSNLILKGPGKEGIEKHKDEVKKSTENVEALEATISARSAEFRAQSQFVTLEAVQKIVPPDSALIEYFSFNPYNAKIDKNEKRRFAVYVLTSTGEPKWADLGEAEPIDRAVEEFRAAIIESGKSRNLTKSGLPEARRQARIPFETAARNLDELVMKPVLALVGNARHLLISPDGDLNLVPFAALRDERGRYLVERYLLTYLTSGRDLLRLQVKIADREPPFVLANPDYEFGQGPILFGASLPPLSRLSGTISEGKKCKELFPDGTLVMEAAATEKAVKSLGKPKLVHIATHGYFLGNSSEAPTVKGDENRGATVTTRAAEVERLSREHPLLRSGLFLVGANKGGAGDDDGTLTALEATGLDLWGTKLVTLSACDTGLGRIKNGEGVYGLRRALVLAGSEAQMMSLWPVSDAGTRDLMIEYYTRLKNGEGRSEALRNVQLKMLKDKKRKSPYFWASFIQSGEWANLEGKR